jgi:hypothetical protein
MQTVGFMMHVYILTLLLVDDVNNHVITATFDFTLVLSFGRIQQDHPGYLFGTSERSSANNCRDGFSITSKYLSG